MDLLVHKHQHKINGTLSCFDRMLFRGYLPIQSGWAMAQFLNQLFRPDIKFRHKLFLNTAIASVLALAGTSALSIAIIARRGDAEGAYVGFIVAVLINLAWLIPALLVIPPFYRSLQYEIHDDEVIVRQGVIIKTVKHVPFRTVTNFELRQGPFDRLFGIGTLKIQTAGTSGQSGAPESLGDLSNFKEVYDQVAAALRCFRGAMTPTQAEEQPELVREKALMAMLEEVRAIRRAVEKQ